MCKSNPAWLGRANSGSGSGSGRPMSGLASSHQNLGRLTGQKIRRRPRHRLKPWDEMGNFKACLCEDVKGLLYLYEASYLAIEGESILEDARDFTTKNLKESLKKEVDQNLVNFVAHALEMPLHWRVLRLEARWFIDVYERRPDLKTEFRSSTAAQNQTAEFRSNSSTATQNQTAEFRSRTAFSSTFSHTNQIQTAEFSKSALALSA
ncbi:hypothetical protein ACSBR1_017390 [Camellia fascicularis]